MEAEKPRTASRPLQEEHDVYFTWCLGHPDVISELLDSENTYEMINNKLREIGKTILDRFGDVSNALKSLQPANETRLQEKLSSLSTDVVSEKERFQLWAANLGLFVLGDRSLDYRMRDNSRVKEYSGKLLNELAEDLLNIYELLDVDDIAVDDRHQSGEQVELEFYHLGGAVSDVEGKQEEGDPEHEIAESENSLEGQFPQSEDFDLPNNSFFQAVRAELDDVVDIIDQLYRLAAKLRNTAARNPPSSRNFYRDQYVDSDGNNLILDEEERRELRKRAKEQTERFHYRRIKEIVRQGLRDEAGMSYPEESERVKLGPYDKDPAQDEARSRHPQAKMKLKPHAKSVVRRIAIATAYRQQQFIFWRQREWHRRHIGIQPEILEATDIPGRHADIGATKEVGALGLAIPTGRKVAISEVPSQTWQMPDKSILLSLDEARSQLSRTEHTVTPTVYEPGGRKVGWPAFPKELHGKKEFICPYCFVTCPPKYRGKGHWRAHLIQDLQPYTCTALVCSEGDNKPLNTWEEWLVHEQVRHRLEYICSDHPDQPFASRELYIGHITSAHSDRKEELLKPQKIEEQTQLSPRPTDGCPLCSYTADNWPELDKHLGFHLETLALLGLPLATGLEKDQEEMGSLQPEGNEEEAELEVWQDDPTEDDTQGVLPDHEDTLEDLGVNLTLNSLVEFQGTLATRSGHDAVVSLLDGMSSINGDTDDQETDELSIGPIESREKLAEKLLQAAKDGDEVVIRKLLERYGADIESKDLHGRTPLSWASQRGHEAAVKLLLAAQADVESKDDEYGQTPLSWAAEHGKEAVMHLLLEASANTESESSTGRSPLAWAAWNGQETAVDILVKAGANVESRSSSGRTPLSWAVEYRQKGVVKLLVEAKAHLEGTDDLGRTPLSKAVDAGDEAIVGVLLEAGADKELADHNGRTPLSLAAESGREGIVKLLLEAGANIASKDHSGKTPLSWAAEKDHESIVKLLQTAATSPAQA